MKKLLLTFIVAVLASVTTFAKDWTALTLGEAVAIPAGETNWCVTADKDGTMTLTAAAGGFWINNLEVYSDAEGANVVMMDVDNTAARFAATTGTTYYITVWNNDGKTGSMVATVEEITAGDYPVLQPNEVFTVPNFGTDIWSYTATTDGTIKIVGDNGDGDWIGSCLLVYDDAAMTHEVHKYTGIYYEFAVVAGHTYYVVNWNMSGQDFRGKLVMGADKLMMTGSEPTEGGMFYITSNNVATLNFTSSVTFTDGEITANGNVVKVYNFNDYNSLVSDGTFTYSEVGTSGLVNWNGNICARAEGTNIVVDFTSATGYSYFNVINRMLEEGQLQAGDVITLTMHGIKSAMTGEILGENGDITLNWTFAGAPTVLVSAAVPEVIKSWYNAGDPEGIAQFVFSKPIQSAMAILEMGNGEASDMYTEYIEADHIIIDGTTVSVDLSGVMRTLTTMNLKQNWGSFTLSLTQVVDVNGTPTFSEDLGSASTYTYTTKYQDISKTLSYEITPATGSTLTAETKDVEIWLGNVDLVEYDGVNVTYYTMETITEKVTEYVYNEETGLLDEVVRDVETEQNIAHDTFISRAELNEVADVDGITITFHLPEGIHTANNVCVKLHVTSSADGREHVVAAYYNTSLMYGLPVEIAAAPASESTVHRLSEIYLPLGFVYSINTKVRDAVIVSSKTNQMFTCGGTVVADGMTQAKIVLDEPITAEGQYTVSVAQGVIGDYNYGESGFTSGTTHEAFNLYYTVDGKYDGRSVISDPFDGETVNSLSQFTFTFFDYNSVAPSWNVDKEVYVQDAEGVRYQGAFVENEATDQVVFVLNQPITTPGTYTFVLTAGSVVNGATGDPINTQYEFTYTVEEGAVPVLSKPVLDPAEGTYDEIANILIDFGQPVTLRVEDYDNGVYWVPQPVLVSADGWSMYAGGTLYATENPNVVMWMQDGVATKGCDATFTIPEGCVQFADGSLNAEYTYNYTITGANDFTLTVVATTPEQWSYVEELSEMLVTFDQPVIVGDYATVTVNDAFWAQQAYGVVVATDEPNTVKLVFNEPIKGFGDASISINSYSLSNADGRFYDQDIYLNVTIGENNGSSQGGNDDPVEGENVTITPDGTNAVASLQYFEVTFGGYLGAWNEQPITLEDAYGNPVATVSAYNMSGLNAEGTGFWELGQPNTYSITLPNEITEAGWYTLVIPVVCEKPDGNTVNRQFCFFFQVDPTVGVKLVKAEDIDEVYTIGGVKTTVTQPGLYIVNGKKVMIRK